MRRLVLWLTALACAMGVSLTVPATADAPSLSTPVSSSPAVAFDINGITQGPLIAVPQAYECWTKTRTCGYKGGVTFNSPNGSKSTQNAIFNKIVGAIKRTPRGEEIRIMSWNIQSRVAVDELLAAQRRGVRVLVIMDDRNASSEYPNPGFKRLKSGLYKFNKRYNVTKARRSYAVMCRNACRRGNAGAAHSKYFLFSAVGKTKWVVIQGSANLTSASTNNQWNDIYTYVDRKGVYDFAHRVHRQMWADKAVWPAWTSYETTNYDLHFAPRIANPNSSNPSTPADPLRMTLDKVTCKGAVSGNANGRTIIRAAPDVLRGKWADVIAKQLKKLWDAGCDVKIGYTIIGVSTRKILHAKTGRGPVPLRHLVADVDGDKVFDKYFHLKAWTINGRIGGDESAYWTMNGSSNISDLARASDENIGIFRIRGVTLSYQKHIEYWFNNPPRSRPVVPSLVPDNLDPYAKMEQDY